jgi:hypothetical protein
MIASARSSSSMFLWNRSAHTHPELSLDLLAEPDGLLEPVGHVVLEAVDRLDRQPDALPGGVLGNSSSASSRTQVLGGAAGAAKDSSRLHGRSAFRLTS